MNKLVDKSLKLKQTNNTSPVKNLIAHIKVMYYNNDPMLASVDDMNALYNALCDLDEIIGMYEVKDSIVKQIKFLLVNNSSNDKASKFDSHMLHTVVFGPPGVGKTTIGSCLANIWKGLGLIEKKKFVEQKKQPNFKSIRILPIPIFLMKENKPIISNENSNEEGSKDKSDETKQTEFNIKTYMEEPDDNEEGESYQNAEPRPEKKCMAHLTKYKRRAEKQEHDLNYKIKELKDELEALTNREKDSLDDKRRYVTELSEYRKKMREFKLLSVGVKNIVRSCDYSNAKPPLNRSRTEAPIKIVSRVDFVGQYIGHSAEKTHKLLINTLEEGKVLFIDEAYSLVLDEKDSFGHEALNEINRFMSEHTELIIIFAGYKDKMEETLFRSNVGLLRRLTWKFEITDYTGEMLSDIFRKQLAKDKWKFEGNLEDLTKFFQDKIKNFNCFGGDTLRLVFYCKLKYSEMKFDFSNQGILTDKTITFDIIKSAYTDLYCKNKPEQETGNETWRSMYN